MINHPLLGIKVYVFTENQFHCSVARGPSNHERYHGSEVICDCNLHHERVQESFYSVLLRSHRYCNGTNG